MGKGGEIFVLNMGSPVKIDDMARDLIRLSGFKPNRDIEIKYIGLRAGEKLFEELITEGEGIMPTDHEKILALLGKDCDPVVLHARIDNLAKLAYEQNPERIVAALQNMLPEYNPSISQDVITTKKPTLRPTMVHSTPQDKTFH
jgi:FlaA1/EpsC-like NDP-sugar epimerase